MAIHEIATPGKKLNAFIFKLTNTPSGSIGKNASNNISKNPTIRPPEAISSVLLLTSSVIYPTSSPSCFIIV